MNFGIHDYPLDYWRFTPEAFRSLLKDFNQSFIDIAGDITFPHTVVGVGFKGEVETDLIIKLEESLMDWKKKHHEFLKVISYGKVKNFKEFVKLFTPPILFYIYKPIKTFLYRIIKEGTKP